MFAQKLLYKYIINALLLVVLYCIYIVPAEGKNKDKPQSVLVEAKAAQLQSFKKQLTVTGTLRANQGIIVRPETSGRIKQIYFKSGTMIAAGAPLIQLNQDIIAAQVQQSEAELQLAKKNYARMQELFKTRTIARAEFDEVAAKLTTASAKFAENKAALNQTLIKAPFTGKLGLSAVSLGDYVNAGQETVSLEAIDPIEVEFSVPQIYLGNLATGQPITITSDAYAAQKFTGQIYAIDALVNLSNRTIAVRASIPNSNGKLLPGTFVEVHLDFTSNKSILVIPQTAVMYDEGEAYVFKLVGDKAIKTKVMIGERDKTNVAVLSGLNVNDMIVTAGQLNIDDGSSIKVTSSK